MTAAHRKAAADRTARFAEDHATTLAQAHKAVRLGWDASPITTGRLCSDLWEVIKEEDWVLCGATNSISNWPQRLWTIDKPYRLIRGGGAAAIGTDRKSTRLNSRP